MQARPAPGSPLSTSKLQTFTARLSPEAKRRLLALAQVEGRPASHLLEAAFWRFWRALPAARQQAAETIAAALEQALAKRDGRRGRRQADCRGRRRP